MSEICDQGYKGCCCCNCKHLLVVRCHLFNKKVGVGDLDDIMGYACHMTFADGEWQNDLMFKEIKHGMCEYYEEKR